MAGVTRLPASTPNAGKPSTPTLPPARDASAFAIDFATLAREIAQDIFEIEDILRMHRLSDEEWAKIQTHPKFIAILADMQRDWNSAANTKERIKVKAQTGLESQLETFIADVGDPMIPLAQRTEAGRFLARLGEVDGQQKTTFGLDDKFSITINIGTAEPIATGPIIEGAVIPEP